MNGYCGWGTGIDRALGVAAAAVLELELLELTVLELELLSLSELDDADDAPPWP